MTSDATPSDEVHAFLQTLEQRKEPIRAAAMELLRAGGAGVLVPLASDDVQLYAIVGTDDELASAFASAEATLVALERGKAMVSQQRMLVGVVRDGLGAAGNAAGMRMMLTDMSPKRHIVAGDLESVCSLAVGAPD